MKKKDLIAGFRQTPTGQEASESSAVQTPEFTPPVRKTNSGRCASFRLDETDKQIIRERSKFLYEHGIKPSDNLIFRAAIRLITRDHRFVEQIRELMAADGRVLRFKLQQPIKVTE